MSQPQPTRPQGSIVRNASSHGRGGAGNIKAETTDASTPPPDLSTPYIKQEHYTTGRGGTGNIVPNENPANARKAQDVDPPSTKRQKEPRDVIHTGRGGQGNAVRVSTELERERERQGQNGSGAGARKGSSGSRDRGLMEKGKELLGLGHKGKKEEGSAIVEEDEEEKGERKQ